MEDMRPVLDELVTANRILAHERVLDSFGHVSIRHPSRPDRFFLSRARAPELVQVDDVIEFTLDGGSVDSVPGKPYSERFIHGAIYAARPDVVSVVHSHSPSVIPFGVTKRRMRPIMPLGASIGADVPNWDIGEKFGDKTNLLVTDMDMGRDFARCLGDRPAALMRGHGSTVVGRSLREAVFIAVYMEISADILIKSLTIGGADVAYLSDGEIATINKAPLGFTIDRGWENWCNRVGRRYVSDK